MSANSKKNKALVNAKLASLKQRRPTPIVIHNSIYYKEHALEFPIYGCWIDSLWKEHDLARIVVARQESPDNVFLGVFLVDPLCLGVKNAFLRTGIRIKSLPRFLVASCGNPEPCPVEFAHQFIYGAIDYAHHYGFEPHPDYNEASVVLDPRGAHPANADIEFGRNGKPLFVSGPNDNVDQILAKLSRTAGEGNFDFVAGFGDVGFDDISDDEIE